MDPSVVRLSVLLKKKWGLVEEAALSPWFWGSILYLRGHGQEGRTGRGLAPASFLLQKASFDLGMQLSNPAQRHWVG